MRGAQPDVECPRCGATAPPSGERLQACTRCGLVFPPHEVQHRPPSVAIPDPPPGVTVKYADQIYRVSWPIAAGTELMVLPLAVVLGWMAGVAAKASWWLAGPFMAGASVCAYAALALLASRQVVVIDATSIVYRLRPFPLARARRFARAAVTEVQIHDGAVMLLSSDRGRERLVATPRIAAARYLADLLTTLLR